MIALRNKQYNGRCKATEEEESQKEHIVDGDGFVLL